VRAGKTISSVLFQLLHDKRPLMRLGSCVCLVNLYNAGALTSDNEPLVSLQLLPSLIRLFDENSGISIQLGALITSIQERSIAQFALLIQDNVKLQSRAMEADAISKLARVLTMLMPLENSDVLQPIPESSASSELLCTSVLLGIAAASSLTEECRKQVIELKLLSYIVTCLRSTNVGVRAAACKCARSLSRSVKQLRTSLVDAGIALPVFHLLFDSDQEVQITASATLCNIVLDFSPMKRIVIENGGVQQLVELVHSSNQELRLNAAWALKNMLFQTDLETKKSVMKHLGWETLCSILNDKDINIQIQALNLWRNLACAKVEVTFFNSRTLTLSSKDWDVI
jgi:armadillo repeat-containing protein 8